MSTVNLATHQLIANRIIRHRDALAYMAVSRLWSRYSRNRRQSDPGRQQCIQDALEQLMCLASAVAMDSPLLFSDYILWERERLTSIGVSTEFMSAALDSLQSVLFESLASAMVDVVAPIFEQALSELSDDSHCTASAQNEDHYLAPLRNEFMTFMLLGDRRGAGEMILAAVDGDTPIKDIYLHVFQPTLSEFGRLWQTNQITVAQEHLCTASIQQIMSQLYPYVSKTPRIGRTLVAASIGSELHEVGCRMVADFFEMDGWTALFFGAQTPAESIVQAINKHHAELLCISATMSAHIRDVAELIRLVRNAETNRRISVMVGGHCFNVDPDLWSKVGADYFAADAQGAVNMVMRAQ